MQQSISEVIFHCYITFRCKVMNSQWFITPSLALSLETTLMSVKRKRTDNQESKIT